MGDAFCSAGVKPFASLSVQNASGSEAERSLIQINGPYLTMIIKATQVLLHFCISSQD